MDATIKHKAPSRLSHVRQHCVSLHKIVSTEAGEGVSQAVLTFCDSTWTLKKQLLINAIDVHAVWRCLRANTAYGVVESVIILDDHTDRLCVGVIHNELEFLIPFRMCAVADCLSALHTPITHCHLKQNNRPDAQSLQPATARSCLCN